MYSIYSMQIGGLHSCALLFLDFGYKWGFWCLLLQRRSWWSQGGTSISTFKTEKWRWIKNANSQGSIIWFGGISTKELLVFPHIHHPQTFSNKPNTNFFSFRCYEPHQPSADSACIDSSRKSRERFFRSEQGGFDKSSDHFLCSALAAQVNLRDVGPLEDDDSLTSAQVWFHSSFAHFKKSERRSKHKRFWPVCRRSSCNTILWKRSISRMKVSRGGVLSITKQRPLGQLQPCPHRRAKNSQAKVPFGSVKTTVKKELQFCIPRVMEGYPRLIFTITPTSSSKNHPHYLKSWVNWERWPKISVPDERCLTKCTALCCYGCCLVSWLNPVSSIAGKREALG